MSRLFSLLVVLCAVSVSGRVWAAEQDWDGGYAQRAERRSGVALSLGAGVGMGASSGYPNSAGKIDVPAFRTEGEPAFGSAYSFWLGGALRDWFTCGVGYTSFGADDGDHRTQASGFIFHLETFPLWSLGGRLRDLALFANFGAGGLTIEGGPETADGGLVSVLGLGTSFELFRFGHFALGPSLESNYVYSQSGEAFGIFLGARTVFYGGP